MEVGERIVIDGEEFEVTQTPKGVISCQACDIKRCGYNEAFKEFKKEHGIVSCESMIGVRKYFKKLDGQE